MTAALVTLALLAGLIVGGAAGEVLTLAALSTLHTLAEDRDGTDLGEEPSRA